MLLKIGFGKAPQPAFFSNTLTIGWFPFQIGGQTITIGV